MGTLKTPVAYSILALILAAGAALRFHALARPSLWDDEMSTLQMISSSRSRQTQRMRVFDFQPPLYFEQLRLWKRVVGAGLGRLRANSALWGTLSLAALFLLGLKLTRSHEAALLAAALAAFSPFHLAYSQELRSYAFAVFLCLLGFWILELWLEKDDGRLLAACLLVMIAELYTHYWGAFVFCAQVAYGWRRLGGPRRRVRWLLLSSCAAASLVFWVPVLLQQARIAHGLVVFWAFRPSPANLVRPMLAFMGLYFRFASSDFTLSLPLPMFAAIAAAYAVGFARGLKAAPLAARLWLPIGLGLPFLMSYWQPGLYVWYRYPVLMYPAFALWVAAGIWSLPARWMRSACAGLALLGASWGSGQYALGWEKANPKSVMAHVNELADARSVVVRPAYFGDLFGYYYAGKAPVFDADSFDSAAKREQLRGKGVVLVAFDVPDDPVTRAFLQEFGAPVPRRFPGHARLGVAVYRWRTLGLSGRLSSDARR
jgi:mannosyltransferase